jgi:hypothetical protein
MALVASMAMAMTFGEVSPGLPALGVNTTLSVSGLSAGAYMAVSAAFSASSLISPMQ